MKKLNGFTITELLAVIIIIGILLVIAMPVYNGINNNVKENIYNSKIETIKQKAYEYAMNNNLQTESITVTTLIEEGYLESDYDRDSETFSLVENPLGGYLDCKVLNITLENGDYNINVLENDNCDISTQAIKANKIKISLYEYDEVEKRIIRQLNNGQNAWSSKSVLIFANLEGVDDPETKITWTANSISTTKDGKIAKTANDDTSSSNIYIVSAQMFLNTNYTMSINSNEGLINVNVNVKIDKEKPHISVDVPSTWNSSNTKDIKIKLSDGNGSGASSFFITSESSKIPTINDFKYENNSNDINSTNDIEEKYDVGTYYAYAIDNANNISDRYEFVISNIDKKGPICLYPKDNSEWSSDSYTYTYGCRNDTASGCKDNEIKSVTVTDSKEYDEVSWTIEDNLGNKTECHKRVYVKIDKESPKCTLSGNSTIWTNTNRTIYYGCEDDSGECVVGYNGGKKEYTTTTKTDILQSYTIMDKAGNKTECQAQTVDVYVDKELPKCTLSGNSTQWTNANRTITYGCEDTDSGCDEKYSGSNKVFSTSTKTSSISSYTIKDKAGNSTLCNPGTVNVYVDKDNPTYIISITNSDGKEGSNYKNSVTINAVCSDEGGSELKSAGKNETKSTRGTLTLSGTCEDNAGNSVSYSSSANVVIYGENSVCGTYNCNARSCNCRNTSCASYSPGSSRFEGCSGPEGINPQIGCPCCTGNSIPDCGVYNGVGCGHYVTTQGSCNSWNTTCDTCYDKCNYSCWY